MKSQLTSIQNNVYKILEDIQMPPNPAVIFDIDSTLIDVWGNSLPQIVSLYHHVLNKGIKAVIITARADTGEAVDYTIKQLKSHGIDRYHSIYFRPKDKRDPVKYKKEARKSLINEGINTVMSIGDEQWDIGEYGGIGVLIPK